MIIVLFLTFFAHCSAAVIQGIDLYGSDHLNVEQMMEAEPELFAKFCEELKAENDVEALILKLSDRLKQKFSLPYVKPTAITYFEAEGKVVYITFDVVESLERLNFQDRPHEVFEDPDHLIAAWDLYMSTAYELLNAGEIEPYEVKTSAFHSVFGHQHPKLTPFEKLFVEGSAKCKNDLTAIFLNDQNDHHRAIAPFLLAYLPEGQELVDLLSKRLRDPSSEVRNNVMRVFACIAFDHPEIVLPVDEVLQALDFPDTTDRNKAAAIIYGLLQQEGNDEKILACSSTLLKMLKLKQPNNSEWAYLILKKISNLDLPKENIADWEQWAKHNVRCLL